MAVASKTQKSAVYTLNLGDTVPIITELNTSSMLGRFLWSSGSAGSQPRALRCLEKNEKLFVIALCQDEMIRVWSHDGQMKLESEFSQADQRNEEDEPVFGLELVESDIGAKVYIQIGDFIYHGELSFNGDAVKLTFIGSVSIDLSLANFCIVENTIWAACREDGDEISVKSAKLPENGSEELSWLDTAPSRPPPELLPPYSDPTMFLLQGKWL